jgi:hypothetical protein
MNRVKKAGSRIRIGNTELTKNLSIFNPKNCNYALRNKIRYVSVYPGSGSRNTGSRISDPVLQHEHDADPKFCIYYTYIIVLNAPVHELLANVLRLHVEGQPLENEVADLLVAHHVPDAVAGQQDKLPVLRHRALHHIRL